MAHENAEKIPNARKLIFEAKRIFPNAQTRVTEVVLDSLEAKPIQADDLLNVSDIRASNIRLFIFIKERNLAEFDREISRIGEANHNAETWRLRAVRSMMDNQDVTADRCLKSAEKMNPSWFYIRSTRAMWHVRQALMPQSKPDPSWLYPQPWSAIDMLPDTSAIGNIIKARERFQELQEFTQDVQASLAAFIWVIALLRMEGKEEDCQKKCSELISCGGNNLQVLRWIDPKNMAAQTIATEHLTLVELSTDQIGLLFEFLLRSDRAQESIALLDNNKRSFEIKNQIQEWHWYRCVALVETDKVEEAASESTILSDPNRVAAIQVHRCQAIFRATKNPDELLAALGVLSNNGNYLALMDRCRLLAHLNKWDLLEQERERIEPIGTPESITFLAQIAARKGDVAVANAMIEKFIKVSGTDRSVKVFQLKAQIAHLLGRQEEFRNATLSLLEISGNQNDSRNALIAAIRGQNPRDILNVASQIIKIPDPTSDLLTSAAESVASLDSKLATDLWLLAARLPPVGDASGGVVLCAHRLGLGDHPLVEAHIQFITKIADLGSNWIRPIPVEELVSFGLRQQADRREILKKLSYGVFSYSQAADLLSEPLAYWFLGIPEKNSTIGWIDGRNLLGFNWKSNSDRHEITKVKPSRLLIDLTSLYSIYRLGILDLVVGNFKTVISPVTSLALIEEARKLEDPQPQLRVEQKLILDYISSGKIQVDSSPLPEDVPDKIHSKVQYDWQKTYFHVKNKLKSTLVIPRPFVPGIGAIPFIPIPTDFDVSSITTISHILKQLESWGLIQGSALGKSFANGTEPTGNIRFPERRERIVLDYGCIEMITRFGLLDSCASNFEISISSNEFNKLRSDVERQNFSSIQSGKVRDLARRVSGNDIVQPHMDSVQEDVKKLIKAGRIASAASSALMSLDLHESDIFVFDDRWTLRHAASSSNCINTVLLIDILLDLKIIDRTRWLALRSLMRTQGIGPIVPEATEIVHWLESSQISAGALVASPELRLLRADLYDWQIRGHFLLEAPRLDGHDDRRILVDYTGAVRRALACIWARSEFSSEARVIYSQWCIDHLWVGFHSAIYPRLVTGKLQNTAEHELEKMTHVDLAFLLNLGIQVCAIWNNYNPNSNANDITNKIVEMNKWIISNCILPAFRACPKLTHLTIKQAIEAILHGSDGRPNREEMNPLRRFLVSRIIMALPVDLGKIVCSLESCIAIFGKEISYNLSFGPATFASSVIWPAISDCLRDHEANALDLQKNSWKLSLSDEGMTLSNPQNEIGLIFSPRELSLLRGSKESRRVAANNLRIELDVDAYEFQHHVEKLADGKIEKRYQTLREMQDASLVVHLSKIEQEFHSKTLTYQDLAGSIIDIQYDLPAHFRCNHQKTNAENQSAFRFGFRKLILETNGVFVSLCRYGHLPFPYSREIVDNFKKLPNKEKDDLLTRLESYFLDPIGKIHLLQLIGVARQCGAGNQFEPKKIVIELIDKKVISEWNPLFSRILSINCDPIIAACQSKGFSRCEGLSFAWAYASIVANHLRKLDIKTSPLTRELNSVQNPPASLYWDREDGLWDNVLYWRHGNLMPYMLLGVSYIITRFFSKSDQLDFKPEILQATTFEVDGKRFPDLHLLHFAYRFKSGPNWFRAKGMRSLKVHFSELQRKISQSGLFASILLDGIDHRSQLKYALAIGVMIKDSLVSGKLAQDMLEDDVFNEIARDHDMIGNLSIIVSQAQDPAIRNKFKLIINRFLSSPKNMSDEESVHLKQLAGTMDALINLALSAFPLPTVVDFMESSIQTIAHKQHAFGAQLIEGNATMVRGLPLRAAFWWGEVASWARRQR